MMTFGGVLFRANEIKLLADVKSSNVVFFAKNVVILGPFLTTRVVIAEFGQSVPDGPTDTRPARIAEIHDAKRVAPGSNSATTISGSLHFVRDDGPDP
jgi:hypothetical protein